jgi:hypothetical protein
MPNYDSKPTPEEEVEQVEVGRIEWWDDYISAKEEMNEEVRSGCD